MSLQAFRQDSYAPKERLPLEELNMLVSFYAQELKPEMATLVSLARTQYGKLLLRVDGRDNLSDEERNQLQESLRQAFEDIKASIYRLQDGLCRLGRAQL